MNEITLSKANELQQRIEEVDSFVYNYNNTWKRGFLKKETKFIVGHKGYGYFKSEEMNCDKELSESIYQILLEYQAKLHKEFKELGVIDIE